MSQNREFLMLAQKLSDYPSISLKDWYWSPKLDGQRAWYDGGVTRGVLAKDVPWANTEKDSRLVVESVATGLWSRYGKVIHAPDWWLDCLPPIVMDGELWIDRGKHQELRGIIGHHSGDEGWSKVKYMCFDMPHPALVLESGRINNPNFRKQLGPEAFRYWADRSKAENAHCGRESIFESRFYTMCRHFKSFQISPQGFKNEIQVARLIQQIKVVDRLDAISLTEYEISLGGEGGVVRDWMGLWTPKRVKGILKIKPYHDDEATVVGYVWGRQTDKGSKLLGLMGALIVEWKGVRFELSGFTDAERSMKCYSTDEVILREPFRIPGQVVTDRHWSSHYFPVGSRVTFRYRELSDAGVPKEGVYARKAEVE